jgi:hypothetical protein
VPANPWAGSTREILTRHCGKCHQGDLPTAVPAALAVFNLLEDPWYGRLTREQYDGMLMRIRGTNGIESADADVVEKFVDWSKENGS